MVGAKGYTDVDRPGVGPAIAPESLPVVLSQLYAPLVEVDSTSFPSGHALAGTIICALFALETDVGTRRQRLAGAAGAIFAIAFARVGAGKHYPIDVLAGVVTAVVFLLVILLVKREVTRRYDADTATVAIFVAVAVISVVSFLVGGRVDAVALFGGAVGGMVAWAYARPPVRPWKPSVERTLHASSGCTFLALGAVTLLVSDWVVVWFGFGVLGGFVVIGLPRLVDMAGGSWSKTKVPG